MAWSVVVVNVAWPLTIATGAGCGTPSNRKVMLPVGTPAPGASAVTCAVNVTGWPYRIVSLLVVTVTAVPGLLTPWMGLSVPVLLLKSILPLYIAWMLWPVGDASSALDVNAAWPLT